MERLDSKENIRVLCGVCTHARLESVDKPFGALLELATHFLFMYFNVCLLVLYPCLLVFSILLPHFRFCPLVCLLFLSSCPLAISILFSVKKKKKEKEGKK